MTEIRITKDGPYHVIGPLPLAEAKIGANSEGESVRWEWGPDYPAQRQYWLCRCGHSSKKPFCDSTHAKVGFDGTETASRELYRDQARLIEGPVLSLTDVESLCAFARFCDPNGKVWHLVSETDEARARDDFVRQTCDCPSGRLVAWDNATGEPIERELPPSIGLVEDSIERCSGSLWVRGFVPVIAEDGFRYERRHPVPLRRLEEQAILRRLARGYQIPRRSLKGISCFNSSRHFRHCAIARRLSSAFSM